MFGLGWQEIVVCLVVGGAVIYLVHRALSHFRPRKSGCAVGCSSCPTVPSNSAEPNGQVIPLERLAASGQNLRIKRRR